MDLRRFVFIDLLLSLAVIEIFLSVFIYQNAYINLIETKDGKKMVILHPTLLKQKMSK